MILLFWGWIPRVSAETSAESVGDILQIALPAAAFGMTFGYDDPGGRTQFYKSFFSTLGTTYALKLMVDKERPDGGNMAFPSGHTSAAFSGASFIQRRYGWKYGVPAYAAAAYVGWSRIDADAHYVEDVVAGAAIGNFLTVFIHEAFLGLGDEAGAVELEVVPGEGGGILFAHLPF